MITHKGTKTIKTERLLLRRFTVNDAEQMFENWANDKRVSKFLTWAPHGSVDNTRELLEQWCAAYDNDNCYNWVIEYEGQAIGNIAVVDFSDRSERTALGYSMGYDYWNKGIMTEAAKAVTDYLFAEVGVNRIEISHAVKNPASGRVAQKCGYKYEGTRREYFKTYAGEFLDIAIYGIIKSDWEKQPQKG